ncbi:hypothetical protein [Vitreimonas flagellata]|uniref:hypothetical protein n=1 Tax=Vitreimonas flagellata TaxID=2560861 RepID=UPI0010751066|nr:hypothetical protein [Vitreimonas flagellata]
MNIAQALAIAAATYAYALHVEEPLSARFSILQAEVDARIAETEDLSREAIERSHALFVQAMQQSASYGIRAYASSSTSQ